MTRKEIIKKAQTECGEYATGYKGDVGEESMTKICEMMWTRSKNLGYSFEEWLREVMDVVGKPNFFRFFDVIECYKMKKMNAGKYCVCLGVRYCN